jgi:cell wall-associated NlpC family hydrolase
VAARLAAAKAARQKAAALRASTEVPAPPPPPTTTAAAPTDTTTTAAATTPAVTTPPLPAVTTPALPPIPTVSPAPSTMPVPAGPLPVGYPQAASIALGYLGVPYVWGGESPSGFDCSGLVAYVYAQLGVALPHYAAAQYTYGVAVPESQLQPGDLVFFANLNHVGIYIGNGQFVNAPHTGAFVEIDSLTAPWFASHYVGARRL